MCAVCRRAAINNKSVDVAQCIRSLSLPMYLIRHFPKRPKSMTVIRSVAAQKIFAFFGQKPPSLPAPRPLWVSGNLRLSPPLDTTKDECGVIVDAGKPGEVVCGWLLNGEVIEKLWAARLGHDANCG